MTIENFLFLFIAREKNKKLGNFRCYGMGSNQVFLYTANKEITKDYFCLDVSKLKRKPDAYC